MFTSRKQYDLLERSMSILFSSKTLSMNIFSISIHQQHFILSKKKTSQNEISLSPKLNILILQILCYVSSHLTLLTNSCTHSAKTTKKVTPKSKLTLWSHYQRKKVTCISNFSYCFRDDIKGLNSSKRYCVLKLKLNELVIVSFNLL